MKDLPSRSTRGKRMTELVGEEKEKDEVFWKQSMFQEAESDEEYQQESEKEDVFDNDFVSSESSEEEAQQAVEEPKPRPKALPSKRRRRTTGPQMNLFTQREMLENAAINEMFNSYSLKKLVELEEDKRQVEFNSKEDIEPTWKLTDSFRKGKVERTIWTTEELSFGRSKPKKPKKCCITGKPTRYTDPLTGKNFLNSEVFKTIREKHYLERESQVKKMIAELETQKKKLN